MSDPGKGIKTTRIVVVILGITLWSFLILVRLIQLQVFEHRSFIQIASQKQQVTRSILAPRGIIYDSHMDELATSVPVSMVVADPHAIKDIPAAAQSLAEILEMNPQDLLNRMTDPAHRYYMVVKHRIDPNAERLIKSLGIEGVYLAEESMRVFPNRELACHVLGFVNMNGDGTYGLEQQYNKELQGKRGSVLVRRGCSPPFIPGQGGQASGSGAFAGAQH